MDYIEAKKAWLKNYKDVPSTLEKVGKIKNAATMFNANIDAVLKISGTKLKKFIDMLGMSYEELNDIKESKLNEPEDVIKGIFRCFSKGIAEEWLSEEKKVYNWMYEHLGYDKLQMGGQGGIVGNLLGVLGIEKVLVHTNSLPKIQADMFLRQDNILSFDSDGKMKPAYAIDRQDDTPMIHWIIEFDKGDSFDIDGHKIVCPKSNRFIATYDPLNLNLVKDKAFVKELHKGNMDYVVISGFHALSDDNDGIKLIDETIPALKQWKDENPKTIMHLELASTQDIKVRKEIVDKIAPLMNSVGVNERETIDVLRVIGQDELADKCEENTHSVNLFEGILAIKKYIKCERIQLHMFGLYITVQDDDYAASPASARSGMELASTVAAGKAGVGSLDKKDNLLWAQGHEVSDIGLKELDALSEFINDEQFVYSGIAKYKGLNIISVPTILVEKPVTLVGMGDTISATSLVGAR